MVMWETLSLVKRIFSLVRDAVSLHDKEILQPRVGAQPWNFVREIFHTVSEIVNPVRPS